MDEHRLTDRHRLMDGPGPAPQPHQRRVGVVGAGYVGLTSAACLAHLGHRVTCIDNDDAKVARLRQARVDIGEPDLARLVGAATPAGRLEFDTDLSRLSESSVVLLCLPTPGGESGEADISVVESVLRRLSDVLPSGCVLVTKSTVPVGTARRAEELLGRPDVAVVSNPEFLREGHAVHDWLNPDRIVIGTSDPAAGRRVAALYQDLPAPVLYTCTASAELAKYASNAFLALKLSYVNEVAELCERLDADIDEVTRVMGLDPRIGPAFLAPGPGWGGSCLPKDTSALINSAGSVRLDFGILRETVRVNDAQADRVVAKIREAAGGRLAGTRVGLLGLTFKAGTGDLRDSPALTVARRLADEGATLTGYDPGVRSPGPADLEQLRFVDQLQVVDDPYLVGKGAAAIAVLTEWPEFRELDWNQLGAAADRATVVDARNLLDPAAVRACGFSHVGIGRSR